MRRVSARATDCKRINERKNVKMTKSLIALAISMFTYFHTSAIAHAGVAQAYPGDKYVEATISAA